jgi:hypothetical protein
MNQPIEGLRDEPKIDGRTREARAARTGIRPDDAFGRSETRPDSVRAAELRAQEIEDNLEGTGGLSGNELDLPANLAPEGWEYQLKAETVAGMDNRHHMLGMYRMGWTPVLAERHPWLMPEGHTGPIMIKGLLLMEKPKSLVDKARGLEKREALDQIRTSEDKLREAPPNTAPRDHEKLPNRATREFMRPVQGDERRESER